MAYELNINIPSFAIIKTDTPAVNDHTSALYKQVSKNSGYDYLLLSPPSLSDIPAELQKRAITSVRYFVYVNNVVNTIYPRLINRSFDPNTITYNSLSGEWNSFFNYSAYDVWSENYSDGRRKGTGWGYITYDAKKETNSLLLYNGACLYFWDYPVGSEKDR